MRIITYLLLFFGLTVVAHAQQDSLSGVKKVFIVDSISVEGNVKTDKDIILRELNFTTGSPVNMEILSYYRERVYSLGIFSKVQITPLFENNKNIIKVIVKESWYFWPIPFASIYGNSINKTTLGINFLYNNFRGRNETLRILVGLGYDPLFSMYYYTPWILNFSTISFFTDFLYQKKMNRSSSTESIYGEEFYYQTIGGDIGFGKRLNQYNLAEIMAGYYYYSTPKYDSRIAASDGRIDHIPRLGAAYTLDTRNLKQYPDSGLYARASYLKKGFGIDKINYSILELDFRHYFQIYGELSGKWRAASRFAFGDKIPFYDYSYLGYIEKIRGHYGETDEGHNYYLASAELKYPLVKEWNLVLDSPLIPKSLRSYRIGIYANAFCDMGTSVFRGEEITLSGLSKGYGAGLTFLILPYNAVRLEFAMNELNRGEFIIGIGFSF